MYCSNCGNNIQEGQKFCQRCGTHVGSRLRDTVQEKIVEDNEKSIYETSKVAVNNKDTQSTINFQMIQNEKKVHNRNVIGQKDTHLYKNIAMVSCILYMVAAFLSYAYMEFLGTRVDITIIDDMEYGGAIVAIGIMGVIFSFFNNPKMLFRMGVTAWIGVFLCVSDLSERMEDNEFAELINKGIGYYLLIVGAFAILIISIKWKKIGDFQDE